MTILQLQSTLSKIKMSLPPCNQTRADSDTHQVFSVQSSSCLTSAGCINHLFQLVINHTIFSKASVENLIKKTHSLASFANSSTKFMCELYLQQEKQYGVTSKWSIKADVVTRYDINCLMLNFCRIKF